MLMNCWKSCSFCGKLEMYFQIDLFLLLQLFLLLLVRLLLLLFLLRLWLRPLLLFLLRLWLRPLLLFLLHLWLRPLLLFLLRLWLRPLLLFLLLIAVGQQLQYTSIEFFFPFSAYLQLHAWINIQTDAHFGQNMVNARKIKHLWKKIAGKVARSVSIACLRQFCSFDPLCFVLLSQ